MRAVSELDADGVLFRQFRGPDLADVGPFVPQIVNPDRQTMQDFTRDAGVEFLPQRGGNTKVYLGWGSKENVAGQISAHGGDAFVANKLGRFTQVSHQPRTSDSVIVDYMAYELCNTYGVGEPLELNSPKRNAFCRDFTQLLTRTNLAQMSYKLGMDMMGFSPGQDLAAYRQLTFVQLQERFRDFGRLFLGPLPDPEGRPPRTTVTRQNGVYTVQMSEVFRFEMCFPVGRGPEMPADPIDCGTSLVVAQPTCVNTIVVNTDDADPDPDGDPIFQGKLVRGKCAWDMSGAIARGRLIQEVRDVDLEQDLGLLEQDLGLLLDSISQMEA